MLVMLQQLSEKVNDIKPILFSGGTAPPGPKKAREMICNIHDLFVCVELIT